MKKKDEILNFPTDKIIEYARNPRKNDHAIDSIASAIKEFGFRIPLLIKSDGTLIDGHLRLKACKKLGMTQVPVIICDDMTEVQIKAFRLSVNKMADLADWDYSLLALEFQELKDIEYKMDFTGFSEVEISSLLEQGTNDPEKAWLGMPDYDQQDRRAFRSIVIHFESQQFVDDFGKTINQNITQDTKYLYFPKQIKEDVKDLRYINEP